MTTTRVRITAKNSPPIEKIKLRVHLIWAVSISFREVDGNELHKPGWPLAHCYQGTDQGNRRAVMQCVPQYTLYDKPYNNYKTMKRNELQSILRDRRHCSGAKKKWSCSEFTISSQKQNFRRNSTFFPQQV